MKPKRRINTKAKGSRRERQTRDHLKEQGYQVVKAGGSLGPFDLVGIGEVDCVLVQVKSNRWPGTKEMQTISGFACPTNARKLVYRWDDGLENPLVKAVGSSLLVGGESFSTDPLDVAVSRVKQLAKNHLATTPKAA